MILEKTCISKTGRGQIVVIVVQELGICSSPEGLLEVRTRRFSTQFPAVGNPSKEKSQSKFRADWAPAENASEACETSGGSQWGGTPLLLVRDTSCPNCAFPPRLFAEHHACFVSEPTHLSRLVCSSTNPARDGAGLQGQGGPIPQPRPYTRFRTPGDE